MLILEAIKRADALCPNTLTDDEKLSICYELSAKIRRCLKKEYDSCCFNDGEEITLPEGVTMADVRAVISGGHVLKKGENLPKISHGHTEIIYLTCPSPYVKKAYSLEAVSDGKDLYLAEVPPCSIGDIVSFKSGKNSGKSPYIQGIYEDRLSLSESLITASEEIEFDILPGDKTECEAPYDVMYVEYLLGKIAYYGENFDLARHYIAQYNSIYTALACYLKERASYEAKKIRNLW